MNYFNYFTEIEDEFIRRRGKHLLVSPLDWSLIEAWKQRGVPLRIALRGINQAFDIYDKQTHKFRRTVSTLFYCQQAVEEAFQQYVEANVGGRNENDAAQTESNSANNNTQNGQLSGGNIADSLHEWQGILTRLSINFSDDISLAEAFDRAAVRLNEISHDFSKPTDELLDQLDSDLNLLESFLLEAIQQHAGAEKLANLRTAGEKDLKNYRKGMDNEVYEQTLSNWIARKLREEYKVPRLSLFYL